ncbi:MAG: hypothetical protein ACJ74H_15545 [Thermoanaerobaculia bacterium]
MKKLGMVVAVMFCATFAYGADEMKNLDWLAGEWKGEASVRMGPGEPVIVAQTEKVTPRAGGKVLLVEGLGRNKAGEVVHDAIALISWDAAKKTYRFIGHVAQQESVDTTLDMTAPNTFVWATGKVRFTIRLTEDGKWNEIGEFSPDGTKWMKFFEMNLTKVK